MRRPGTFDDVVDVTTFHTEPEAQLDTVMAVRTAENGGFDFEIKVIARIPAAG